LPRFKEVINVLKRHNVRARVLVDLGCNDGNLTIEMAKAVEAEEVYCVDIDVNALNIAKNRGLKNNNSEPL